MSIRVEILNKSYDLSIYKYIPEIDILRLPVYCGRLTCAKCRSLYLTLAPGLASDIPLFPRLGARLRGDRVTSRGRWTRAGAKTVPTGDPRRVLVRKARYNIYDET